MDSDKSCRMLSACLKISEQSRTQKNVDLYLINNSSLQGKKYRFVKYLENEIKDIEGRLYRPKFV